MHPLPSPPLHLRFNSVSEYDAMVRDLREGRLRAVSAKGEKLRAVTLQRKWLGTIV